MPGGALKEGAVKNFVIFTGVQFSQISYRVQNIEFDLRKSPIMNPIRYRGIPPQFFFL